MLTEEGLAENGKIGLGSADVEDAVLEGLVFVGVGDATIGQKVKAAHIYFFYLFVCLKFEAQSEKLKLGREV